MDILVEHGEFPKHTVSLPEGNRNGQFNQVDGEIAIYLTSDSIKKYRSALP